MIDRIEFRDEKIVNCDFPHSDLTSLIIACCFEVINELGAGYLELVYKNALCIALRQNGLLVETEKTFEVYFRQEKAGMYTADLIVEKLVIIELKCCKCLLPEHQAQVINYLKTTNTPIGILVNFGNKKIEYKRLHHPSISQELSEVY